MRDHQMRCFDAPLFSHNSGLEALTIVEASPIPEVPALMVTVPLTKQRLRDLRDILDLIEARGLTGK